MATTEHSHTWGTCVPPREQPWQQGQERLSEQGMPEPLGREAKGSGKERYLRNGSSKDRH